MKKRIRNVCLIITAVVFYTLFVLYFNIGLRCPFHTITGLDCGFCGVTRSVISMLHGDFKVAFSYNPLIMPLIIPGTLMLLFTAYEYIIGKPFSKLSLIRFLYIGRVPLILLFLVFTLLRNVF